MSAPQTPPHTASVLAIAQRFAPVTATDLADVLDGMTLRDLAPGEALLHVGQAGSTEFFVLHGLLRTSVGDAQGREVTLGFHPGPGVLPPAITRTRTGCSRVDCTALAPTRVAGFASERLVALMLRTPAMQRWGDAVLHTELLRRADREWALAALPALERLQQLRQELPDLESQVPHHYIASYLGVTPVTLSRVRRRLRDEEPD